MRILRLIPLFFTLLGGVGNARADLARNLVSTGWQLEDNFLSHRGLRRGCSAIRNIRIDPPCNPAFLGLLREDPIIEETEGLLAAQLMIGDNFQYFYKNRDLLSGANKQKMISDLLSQKEPVGFEAEAQMWWKQNSWVFEFKPARLHSYSEVVNSAYPNVLVEGAFQQAISAMWGTRSSGPGIEGRTYFGFQMQYLERQVVYENIYLFEALPRLDDYFRVQKQRAFLLEPGLSFDLGDIDSDWNPQLSFKLSQLGIADRNIESLPLKPILDIGYSIAPALFYRNFELAFNYRPNSEKEPINNMTLSSSASYTWVQVYFGLENEAQSLGFATRFRNWSSGLTFQQEKSPLEGRFRRITFLEFKILI